MPQQGFLDFKCHLIQQEEMETPSMMMTTTHRKHAINQLIKAKRNNIDYQSKCKNDNFMGGMPWIWNCIKFL